MSAFVGKKVLIEFAIALESAAVGGLTWQTLGMMRGKSMKTSWDDVDTTADGSGDTKTALATFKNVEFSGDGVSRDDAVYKQKVLHAHFHNPTATGGQPLAWIRMTDPDGSQYVGPFLLTEWSDDRPYDGSATWSLSAKSNGNVTYTAA